MVNANIAVGFQSAINLPFLGWDTKGDGVSLFCFSFLTL